MPINLKQFKKIVTNHFENLTEEEFLSTLHKSSPRLSDEKSEQVQNVRLHDRNKVVLDDITRLQ